MNKQTSSRHKNKLFKGGVQLERKPVQYGGMAADIQTGQQKNYEKKYCIYI